MKDTGVKLSLWGPGGRYLYTGSSDGVIKQWDPNVAPEDALVAKVATLDSGIMTGDFSPDFAHLLVGTAKGSIRILTTAPSASAVDEGQAMHFIPAAPPPELPPSFDTAPADELLASGQVTLHPYWGIGQGPAYSGPYASWARDDESNDLDPNVLADQRDPEQWKRGMLAGGRPTIDTHRKKQWLEDWGTRELQESTPPYMLPNHSTPQATPEHTASRPGSPQRAVLQPSLSRPSTPQRTSARPSPPRRTAQPTTPQRKTPRHSTSRSNTPVTPWSASRPRPAFRCPSSGNTPDRTRVREQSRAQVRDLARRASSRGDIIDLDDL